MIPALKNVGKTSDSACRKWTIEWIKSSLESVLKLRRSRTKFEHPADTGDVDHSFMRGRAPFIIAGQPPGACEPCERALDDPAAREHHKAFGSVWATYDVECPAEGFLDEGHDVVIRAIGPDFLEATPAIVDTVFDLFKQSLQGLFAALPVWGTGTMHDHE